MESKPVHSNSNSLITKFKNQWVLLLMISPSLVMIFIFGTVPLSGLWMAFTRYKIGRSIFEGEFVGLKNFARLFIQTGDIGYLLRNTLIVNISNLAISSVLSIAFSVFLKELRSKKFSKFVQTVSFIPYFISWVIVYSIVAALMSVNTGAINQLLVMTGLADKGINVLGREEYAYGLTIFLSQWKSIGYNSVLYLAAMGGISPELYEAVAIDGAGRFRSILYITLPGISATFCILLIMAVSGIFNSGIDYFFVFTNSTNWRRMEMFDMYIYSRGMQKSDFSYATAVGLMKSAVGLILLFAANKVTKKIAGSGLF